MGNREDVPNPVPARRVRRGSTRLWSAIGLLALCVSLSAQAPVVPRTGQASPRTATLSGRVVDFTTNEPVPGVLVQIGGPANAAEIAAENGTFEFTNLPAGSYTVSARRNGYLPDYGSPRPGARGRTTVDLESGGRGDITVRLLRGGVIAGQVLDADGRPVEGALVTAAQRIFSGGRRRLMPFANSGGLPTTDDEGRFRVTSLPPGRYVLSAMPQDEPPRTTLTGPVTNLGIRTYVPNATDLSEASVIELGPGERHLDVTIVLARGRPAALSGIALLADGSPAVGASINLRGAQQNLDEVLNFALHRGSTTDASGRFHLDNVMPGRFVVDAWSRDGHRVGEAPVEMAGTDIEAVVLQETIVTLRGRFVRDDGTPVVARSHFPTSEGPGALCVLEVVGSFESPSGCFPTTDGFEIRDAAVGRYWLSAMSSEGDSVRLILQGSRDITDEPLVVSPEVRNEPITITLSRAKQGSVTGTVTDTLGHPQDGVPVVVFSTDPKRWWVPGARYVKRWTTNGKGVFTVDRLAPGEYFVATASDVDDWAFSQNGDLDPDLLETLRAHATIVNLVDGETRTVSLTIRQ